MDKGEAKAERGYPGPTRGPKRERDREAHLNYYASAYKLGDNYPTARQN